MSQSDGLNTSSLTITRWGEYERVFSACEGQDHRRLRLARNADINEWTSVVIR
jgi:hypothetical protein